MVQYKSYDYFEKAIAEKMPEKCNNCNCNREWIIERKDTSIGTSIHLICQKCGNKIDITPYEFW